ncbi:MAG: hypothetical protein LBU45_00360, partial [Azoarcus sp.]|nr:hypothetical protein [Azoarcus sp.]
MRRQRREKTVVIRYISRAGRAKTRKYKSQNSGRGRFPSRAPDNRHAFNPRALQQIKQGPSAL